MKTMKFCAAIIGFSMASYAATACAQVGIDKCLLLSQSDSYKLTSNIPKTPKYLLDGSCLEVAADFVTIDLNGFSIIGNGTGTGSGVTDAGIARVGTTIKNGSIRGFASSGVDLSVSSLTMIDGLIVTSNSGQGIAVGVADPEFAPDGGNIVMNSRVEGNELNGIVSAPGDRIVGNTVLSNGRNGIFVSVGTLVKGNVVRGHGNDGAGIGNLGQCLIVQNVVTGSGSGGEIQNPLGCDVIDNFGTVVPPIP